MLEIIKQDEEITGKIVLLVNSFCSARLLKTSDKMRGYRGVADILPRATRQQAAFVLQGYYLSAGASTRFLHRGKVGA
jgi:hypothetical protein